MDKGVGMKRRVVLVLGLAGLLVLAVAGVALAGTFVGTNQADTCPKVCGGDNNDNIYGLNGGDTMRGAGGNDYMEGGLGNDFIHGDSANDQVWGGPGADDVFGDDGQDHVDGGLGGDSTINGGAGKDVVISVDSRTTDQNVSGGSDEDWCIYDDFGGGVRDGVNFSSCEHTFGADTEGFGP